MHVSFLTSYTNATTSQPKRAFKHRHKRNLIEYQTASLANLILQGHRSFTQATVAHVISIYYRNNGCHLVTHLIGHIIIK